MSINAVRCWLCIQLWEKQKVDIPWEGYIPFYQKGLTRGGITHDEVNSPEAIGIKNTGIYEVTFYVSGGTNAIVGLELNGNTSTSLTYTTVANEAVFGQALIEVTLPNSILKLKVLDDQGIQLADNPNPENDPYSVNASVVIERVCNILKYKEVILCLIQLTHPRLTVI